MKKRATKAKRKTTPLTAAELLRRLSKATADEVRWRIVGEPRERALFEHIQELAERDAELLRERIKVDLPRRLYLFWLPGFPVVAGLGPVMLRHYVTTVIYKAFPGEAINTVELVNVVLELHYCAFLNPISLQEYHRSFLQMEGEKAGWPSLNDLSDQSALEQGHAA